MQMHEMQLDHDPDIDRGLASAPNTIEIVKISIPRGLFLIAIS